MSKLTVVCQQFKPLRRNTLVGFAQVFIPELKLSIKDIALHRKGESRWAALPAKPMLDKTGAVIRDATSGKISYSNIFEFTDRATRDAFSNACVRAVIVIAPDAFAEEAA